MDVENAKDFQKEKNILTVVKLVQGVEQRRTMIDETNANSDIYPA